MHNKICFPILLATAACALLLAGCDAFSRQITASANTVSVVEAPQPTMVSQADLNSQAQTDAQLEGQLVQSINSARTARGLPSLSRQPLLDAIAQRYAVTLAQAGRIAHKGIDGTTLRDRVDSGGYAYRYFNENLSAGYPTPELVVEGWMNSTGHRQNLLEPRLQDLGVGYARAGSGDRWTHYWVMVGGQPAR